MVSLQVASAPGINKLLVVLPANAQGPWMAASILQKVGLIRFSRGKLVVPDRRGREAASRQVYWAVTKEVERMYIPNRLQAVRMDDYPLPSKTRRENESPLR